jgi:environmental stress-induced protein Ves
MQLNIISPSQFKTLPWKNGKGSTKELLFENIIGEEAFAWRLSMAPVTEDGPFSDFSGYDRTLILVEGNGIVLRHDNGQSSGLMRRFDSANFDGSWITEATLLEGEITDFNVMTRQGICTAQVDIFDSNDEHQVAVDADRLMIYPLDAAVGLLTPQAESRQLPATHLLQVIAPDKGVWKISGQAVICVQINYSE